MTTPCEHVMEIESVTDVPVVEGATVLVPPRRVVHSVCTLCGFTQDMLTNKTDEQITAETGWTPPEPEQTV